MESVFHLTRPVTLVPGDLYKRLAREEGGGRPCCIPVRFVAYSACPAWVVVADGEGRERCPRDELFDLQVIICTTGTQRFYEGESCNPFVGSK